MKLVEVSGYPAGSYMFKINNTNSKVWNIFIEICSKGWLDLIEKILSDFLTLHFYWDKLKDYQNVENSEDVPEKLFFFLDK